MASGVYKRTRKEIDRIKRLRLGLIPWNKGIPWDLKVKERISKARLKNPIGYWKGKHRSKITKERISNTRISRGCGIGAKNPYWKGGRRKDRKHIQVLIDGKYYYEHRIIMEKELGRKLKSSEIVHHKDGNGSNNKIENLELLKNQSEHVRKFPTLAK